MSLNEWWLLGTAPCANSGTCGAIVRTTDGGSGFVGIPSPDSGAGEVSELRFANALDGYAFDPQLWQTTNGGATWVETATSGKVVELEASDGEAYALVCAAGSANCQSMDLLRSPVGSRTWQQLSTLVPLGYGSQFAVSGPNLYLLSGSEHPVLQYSADKGASFSRRDDPCFRGLGGAVSAAADGSSTLWAACPTGMMAEALLSTDGGRTWRGASTNVGFPNSVALAPASASVAIAWPHPQSASGALVRTSDGGQSYSVVLSGPSSARILWAGFSDAVRAYALLSSSGTSGTAQLLESNDAGTTWRSIVIKRG